MELCGAERSRIKCSQLKRQTKARIAITIKLLKKCSRGKDLQTGRRIHSEAVQTGDISQIYLANTLLDMYCKCGSMSEARKLFDSITQRSVVSWTSIIFGYAQHGSYHLALDMFSRMQDEGFVPDRTSFLAVLKACSSLVARDETMKPECLEKGKAIHSLVQAHQLEMDNLVASSLMDLYCKCNNLVEAQKIFEKMIQQDVVAWSAIIMGYAENGNGRTALELYKRMTNSGCSPNRVTFMAVLKACGHLTAFEAGRKVEAEIHNAKLQKDPLVVASLVDFYGKCGFMDRARELFETVATRDVVTWNALLSGYSWQGECHLVLELFERMLAQRIRPDGIIFIAVLTACSQGGLVSKGVEYFERMSREYGLAPGIKHYTCMVDLLGRANRLDEGVDMIRIMSVEADVRIWMVLLGACQKWGNVQVGQLAFDSVLRLEKSHPAAYVVMANILSSAGMREESEVLRSEGEAWKDKSKEECRWTDTNGVVHGFATGFIDDLETLARVRGFYEVCSSFT